MLFSGLAALVLATSVANAYFLVGSKNFITQQRLDPIISPNQISGHVHSVLGGSNFGFNVTTEKLRKSECTSMPITEDKSNYWFPSFYFQWENGSFSSLSGGSVVYYLFGDASTKTTPFPDEFRMISGNPMLRTYDASSKAQQAITYLCLDFNGKSSTHNSIPAQDCPSGIRAQINFPSCWDGKNTDSEDHQSHVAFPSDGADKGTCKDPKYPVTLPRIFIEVYWDTASFYKQKDQAMNKEQPFVLAYGDRTGYGYHADFINGWEDGVLERVLGSPGCRCNDFGDPQCCADKGIFTLEKEGSPCRITNSVDERVFGTLDSLPGNNPVVEEGDKPQMLPASFTPGILSPVYVYHGDQSEKVGQIVTAPVGSDDSDDGKSSAPSGGDTLSSGQSNSNTSSNSRRRSCNEKSKRSMTLKRHHRRLDFTNF